jgi:hypothetical protein
MDGFKSVIKGCSVALHVLHPATLAKHATIFMAGNDYV